MQKNACWVFETVKIISIKISFICFTEKVYGSSPYSPNTFHFFFYSNFRISRNNKKKNSLQPNGPKWVFVLQIPISPHPLSWMNYIWYFSYFPVHDKGVSDTFFFLRYTQFQKWKSWKIPVIKNYKKRTNLFPVAKLNPLVGLTKFY